MALGKGASMVRLYAIGAGVALVIGLVVWIRQDAAQDTIKALDAASKDARIEAIEDAREISDETDKITGADLDRELCQRLSSGPC